MRARKEITAKKGTKALQAVLVISSGLGLADSKKHFCGHIAMFHVVKVLYSYYSVVIKQVFKLSNKHEFALYSTDSYQLFKLLKDLDSISARGAETLFSSTRMRSACTLQT